MRSRDVQATALIALTLVASAFLLGSAPRWASCVAAALGALTALPYLRSSRTFAGGLWRAPLLVLLGLALAFSLLQLLPLPAPLVDLVASARYDLAADNAAALGEDPPSLIPLTLDPPATLVEAAKLSGYLLFAYACLRLAASGRRGRHALLSSVAFTGAAVALTGLGHRAVGASSLFGLYEPHYASPSTLAPFINANHFASFTALSAAISLGLALHRAGPHRTVYMASTFICAAAALTAASRGGAVALSLGLLATLGLFILHRRRERDTALGEGRAARAKIAALAVIFACAAAIVVALTAGPVTSQLAETARAEELRAETRFALWRAATALIADYPLAGVGRGAFVHAFPSVYEYSRLYAYLENSYLQAVVDFGIPAALALAGALFAFAIAAVRRALSSRTSLAQLGAFGGLFAVAAHNLVDFNLELPGMAMAAIAAAACLTPPALTRGGPATSRPTRLLRAGAVVAALAVIAIAASPAGSLARAQTQLGVAEERGKEAAEAAFRRHPSSFMAAGELAYALYLDGDPRALRVASRALFLSPEHPDLHLLTARILAATEEPQQALVHYSRALEHGASRAATARELRARFPDREDAVRGLPLSERAFPRLVRAVRENDPELALKYARRFERLGAAEPESLLAIAEIERDLGDPDRAVTAAAAAKAERPGPETAIALARSHAEAGDLDAAIATLDTVLDYRESGEARAELLESRAELLRDSGDLEAARAGLQELIEGVTPRAAARRAHRELAEIEDELGNPHQAEWHRSRAQSLGE